MMLTCSTILTLKQCDQSENDIVLYLQSSRRPEQCFWLWKLCFTVLMDTYWFIFCLKEPSVSLAVSRCSNCDVALRSALWRATVIHHDSEWLNTAPLTLVAVKMCGWDVLPIFSGAQTLPLQTATFLALWKITYRVSIMRMEYQSRKLCLCVCGMFKWTVAMYIEAHTILHKCVPCNADCAEKWQNILRHWGLYIYLCCCVMWVLVLYFQCGSCTEKLMDHFVPDHIYKFWCWLFPHWPCYHHIYVSACSMPPVVVCVELPGLRPPVQGQIMLPKIVVITRERTCHLTHFQNCYRVHYFIWYK